MIYDVPFRHEQALDPSALTTVIATLHAMGKAVDDCRNAGVDPNSPEAEKCMDRNRPRLSAECRNAIGDYDRRTGGRSK